MRFLVTIIVSFTMIGCTSSIEYHDNTAHTDLEILQAGASALPETEHLAFMELGTNVAMTIAQLNQSSKDKSVIESDHDSIAKYFDRHTDFRMSKAGRLEAIVGLFFDDNGLTFNYEADGNYSVEKALELNSGNCLTFANTIVSLARAQGLEAGFQYVNEAAMWVEEASDSQSHPMSTTYVNHVNAVVRVAGRDRVTIDINSPSSTSYRISRPMSDQQAYAEYLNNHAHLAMIDGDFERAHRLLSAALQTSSDSGGIWSNLGVLYRRTGQHYWSEQAYLRGANASFNQEIAISNLERFYRASNRTTEANLALIHINSFRNSNPLVHIERARASIAQGDFNQAVEHLDRSMDITEDLASAHYLMGISHEMLGNKKSAQRYFNRAENLTEGRTPDYYQAKLSALQQLYGHVDY